MCLDDPEVFQFLRKQKIARLLLPETTRRVFTSALMTSLQTRCKDVGAPVWGSGGSKLRPIPVVNASRQMKKM